MERLELINALRLVMDYCEPREDCEDCLIMKECSWNVDKIPEHWRVGDDV